MFVNVTNEESHLYTINDICIMELYEYPYGFWWGLIEHKKPQENSKSWNIWAKIENGRFRVDDQLNPIFSSENREYQNSYRLYPNVESTRYLINRILTLGQDKISLSNKYQWLEELHIKCKI